MKEITNRLSRARGQIEGLSKMIEKGEDCEKVIIQFQAVKQAINKAFSLTLEKNLKECLDKKNKKDLRNILDKISRQ